MDVHTLASKVRPPTGKVIVLLDQWAHTRLVGSVWLVDSSATKMKHRLGTVLVVSKQGMQILGGYTVPHAVKRGDRVMVERSAAKNVPGGAMRSGDIIAVWENYIAAILEDEPDRDQKLLDAGLDDLVPEDSKLRRPVCIVCHHAEPVVEISYADSDVKKKNPFHATCWRADMAVRQAAANAQLEAEGKVLRPGQEHEDD